MKKVNVEKLADLWAVGLALVGGVAFYSTYKYGKIVGMYKGANEMKKALEEELRKIGKDN